MLTDAEQIGNNLVLSFLSPRQEHKAQAFWRITLVSLKGQSIGPAAIPAAYPLQGDDRPDRLEVDGDKFVTHRSEKPRQMIFWDRQ